ncbi:hypothetical protein P3T27_002279 [Kitasatospora sp. MAA19]|uniref:hypothetical protein n=1 Tax=Kitasatospora sp. MAA19 TaxID=3035090 RepID=UPI00247710B2|nr:hypothetical protein [Kitasatospora sp. MAA19]MDH6705569.1 hypothetical protein [Kitasatospora sp. MAA19]
MAEIMILYELDQAQAESPEGDESAVLLVHAAGRDPEVRGPWTLRGKDTGPMGHSHDRPERPGAVRPARTS